MTMISFRMDDSDAAQVQAWARRLGIQRSELVREALRRHLLRLASEDDAASWEKAQFTEAEQALARVGDWGPAEDWADWADATR